ncbi:MAG: RIP metalloprotease RseP [Flavobacteriaceae bacterium]|nr:MAG: RIP metalloprotease RseP [Flavobacteriaceae bacterium]
MEIIIKAAQFILSLSFLIVLHELGHFIPAKLFKTRVEKFYLFFDYKFSIFKTKIGGTEYGIGWIPLGGYVKIAGMIDESMDTEAMKQPAQPWEFRSKPAWQRLIIMLGGVFVNFMLGGFIYIMIVFVWGGSFSATDDIKYGFSTTEIFHKLGFEDGDKITTVNKAPFKDVTDINMHLFLRDVSSIEVRKQDGTTKSIAIPSDIGHIMWKDGNLKPFEPRALTKLNFVSEDSPAAKAGLKIGDEIVSVNGNDTKYWNSFKREVLASDNPVVMQVMRNGVAHELSVVLGEDKIVGVRPGNDGEIIQKIEYTFGESIVEGTSRAVWKLKDYIAQFTYIFTKKGATSIGGFIAIGSIFPSTWSWHAFWEITAFLSIMLGFMNLLPIPALDGGHVVFTLFEMITGRKPNDKFLEYAQMAGIIFLLALMLLANGNDIVKLFQ